MATITDLNTKRTEMNNAVQAYRQAQADYAASSITLAQLDAARVEAQTKGDEYAKLAGQVKSDNPSQPEDDFYSNPTLQSSAVRSDVAEIVRFGSRLGMILVIDTEATTPGNKTAAFPIGGNSNYEIDWGDGTVENLGGGASHTYATAGVYTVGIKGQISSFGSNPNPGTERLITEVKKWGGLQIDNFSYMFKDRLGFAITATDQPLFPDNAVVLSMFEGAEFTGDISFWNTAKLRNTNSMFKDNAQFTSDITGWDMSNVVNFTGMFVSNPNFNQNIAGWDVSSAVTMDIMFYNNTAFNQDISGWNVASVNSHNNFAGGTSVLALANQPSFPV